MGKLPNQGISRSPLSFLLLLVENSLLQPLADLLQLSGSICEEALG